MSLNHFHFEKWIIFLIAWLFYNIEAHTNICPSTINWWLTSHQVCGSLLMDTFTKKQKKKKRMFHKKKKAWEINRPRNNLVRFSWALAHINHQGPLDPNQKMKIKTRGSPGSLSPLNWRRPTNLKMWPTSDVYGLDVSQLSSGLNFISIYKPE